MKFQKRVLKRLSDGGGSNLFLKIGDGESNKGVCRGEVYEFYQKWEGGRSQVVTADDPSGKSRFRVNLIVEEDGVLVAKIWEFGLPVYNQLSDINEEYDVDKTKIKISRRGSGKGTEWAVLPLLKEPLSERQLKDISSVKLNLLDHRQESA